MGIRYKILQDMRREKVIQAYTDHNRFIEPEIYKTLKARKKCHHCHKKFSGRVPEIHHKVPLSKGGTNDISNLMALCKKCHAQLDKEQGVRTGGKNE